MFALTGAAPDVVTILFNAHPQGADTRDKVRQRPGILWCEDSAPMKLMYALVLQKGLTPMALAQKMGCDPDA